MKKSLTTFAFLSALALSPQADQNPSTPERIEERVENLLSTNHLIEQHLRKFQMRLFREIMAIETTLPAITLEETRDPRLSKIEKEIFDEIMKTGTITPNTENQAPLKKVPKTQLEIEREIFDEIMTNSK
ncbi:MAG: hypothetical protein RBS56_02275 [Candidatus Gracilibacteria bacterium]|jgi:hypothetical protein|nr:hypothetical protein [Candidatus Gracilibacteria bacterium]